MKELHRPDLQIQEHLICVSDRTLTMNNLIKLMETHPTVNAAMKTYMQNKDLSLEQILLFLTVHLAEQNIQLKNELITAHKRQVIEPFAMTR